MFNDTKKSDDFDGNTNAIITSGAFNDVLSKLAERSDLYRAPVPDFSFDPTPQRHGGHRQGKPAAHPCSSQVSRQNVEFLGFFNFNIMCYIKR